MIVILEPGLSSPDVERIRELVDRYSDGSGAALAAVGGGRQVLRVSVEDGTAAGRLLAKIPGVDRVVQAKGPYPMTSIDTAQRRSTVRIAQTEVGAGTFTLVAGPCAVETAEQARAGWAAAAAAGAAVLRGDLFKHRTSPYSFQGLGAAGVELLREQRRMTRLPMVLEVLSARDINAVADVADAVRVGARNMYNRDLLLECGRLGKPVIIKRGLSATVEEWLLSAETVASAGNLDIILCERGIRTFETATRNTLDLSAVPLLQEQSHLPVIVDPSHASGRRSLVAALSLAAVAAGADGVMLDVHARPDTALCDGPQALLPQQLVNLGGRLHALAEWMGRVVQTPAAGTAGVGSQSANVSMLASVRTRHGGSTEIPRAAGPAAGGGRG